MTKNLKSELARTLADYDNLRKQMEKQRYDLQVSKNKIAILGLMGIWASLSELQSKIDDPALKMVMKECQKLIKEFKKIKQRGGE